MHKRVQQIKGVLPENTFGGVSVMAVGDLYQLSPACQSPVFSVVNDSYSSCTVQALCALMSFK